MDLFPQSRDPPLRETKWKKDVVYLYQFDRFSALPNPSPFCLKLETYIRAKKIPHEARFLKPLDKKGKNGLLPFIELNGQHYTDSQLIIYALQEILGLKESFTAEQEAIAQTICCMLDSHTIYLLNIFKAAPECAKPFSRLLLEPYGVPSWMKSIALPWATNKYKNGVLLPRVRGAVGPFSDEQLKDLLRRDLDALATFLGGKKFFFGNQITFVSCLCTMLGALVVLAVLTIVTFLYARRLLSWLHDRKRFHELVEQFPGEKPLPLLGNTHQMPLDPYDFADYLIKLANKHSAQGAKAVKFSVGTTVFVLPLDGATLKDILDSTVELTKGTIYDFLVPCTDDKWRSRRKMLTPTFHFRMLDSYQETFNSQTKRLVCILEKFTEDEEVDLFPFVKRCALDIICETAMGTTVDAQSNHDHSYVRAVRDMSHLAFVNTTQPWCHFTPIFYALGYGRQRDEALNILLDFTREVIAERQSSKKSSSKPEERGRVAFLDMLLDLAGDSKLNDEDIREEVDTFMFEGHDTTSSGIGFTLWALACHPEVQERAAAELYEIFGDSNRDVTKEDLKEMKYTEMCIKEALRLFPPVPFVNRIIRNEDFKLGDKVVPPGVNCTICPLIVHHNEQLYPDSFTYKPDRFLSESLAQRHPYDFVPFSAGPRNCIGQKFAMNEEKTVVAWILRKFQMEATIPFSTNRAGLGATLSPSHGVPVHLKRRVFN